MRQISVRPVAQQSHPEAQNIPDWLLTAIVRIVTTYTTPGHRVLLLAAPAQVGRLGAERDQLASCRPASASDQLPGLVEAAAVAARLGRSIEVRVAGSVVGVWRRESTASTVDHFDAIVTAVDPQSADWTLAVPWSTLLAPSGTLSFITHGDQVQGRWADPFGLLIHLARHTGLAEIDRIALLEVPIQDGTLASRRGRSAGVTLTTPSATPHHARVHSDLLVFALPRTPDPTENGR
ncbi:hypothetical protein [Streptomyces fulvoviolaceus]|uniref:hypothetical protein n=1 Tax=Streptomyces fulvoviolaceus TaxID=285535 RepID=UPI0021BFF997|nr:hypothetical protein [Streptomyces fulvoviolaceus]MCT9084462.1 hypothetical protein [Streptomyces fulvoviolaceus]